MRQKNCNLIFPTLFYTDLCEAILLEIFKIADFLSNKKTPLEPTPIVEIQEEDLMDSFTKGGVAGRLNKTSSPTSVTQTK